jgi:CheY-like chemotaxis protein
MKRPTVLLIDDDAYLVGILRQKLEAQGVRVLTAGNGEDGLRMVHEEAPDTVLLDIAMPKKDGLQVLAELKADPETRRMPVLMLTHLSAKEDIESCLRQGACAYLIKSQHSVEEILAQILRQLLAQPANGFTLLEWLVVAGVLLLSMVVAAVQFSGFEARGRDTDRLAAAQILRASLTAASQDRLVFSGCRSGQALADCRVCLKTSCRGDEDKTLEYLPRELFALDIGAVCAVTSTAPCRTAIEAVGSQPLTLGSFRLRFFFERERGGLAGGKTHVLDSAGVLE